MHFSDVLPAPHCFSAQATIKGANGPCFALLFLNKSHQTFTYTFLNNAVFKLELYGYAREKVP